MLLNELVQWAVLIVLAVSTFGLLRQLGQFLVPRREQLLSLGPDIGEPVPRELIDEAIRPGLRERVASSPSALGFLAVMNEGCLGCQALIEQLEASGRPTRAPLLAIVDGESSEFQARLERHFDVVVADPGRVRARAAGIVASPYLLAFDANLRVRQRAISGSLRELVREWTTSQQAPT